MQDELQDNTTSEQQIPPQATQLTDREEKFCWAYVTLLNKTQAALEAGYSPDSAKELGYKTFTKVHIQNRIAEIRANSAGKFDLGKETLIQELAHIARFDLRTIYNEDGTLKKPSEWSDEAGAALAGVEVDEIFTDEGEFKVYTKKVKRDNKISAIAEINKMMGYYAPVKSIVNNTGNVAISFVPAQGNDPLPE